MTEARCASPVLQFPDGGLISTTYFTALFKGQIIGLRNNLNKPLEILYLNNSKKEQAFLEPNGGSIWLRGAIWVTLTPGFRICLMHPWDEFRLVKLLHEHLTFGIAQEQFEIPSDIPEKPNVPTLAEIPCRGSEPSWEFLNLILENDARNLSLISCYDATLICSNWLHERIMKSRALLKGLLPGADFELAHFCLTLVTLLRKLHLIDLNKPIRKVLCGELALGKMPQHPDILWSLLGIITGITPPPKPQAWLDFWAHCVDHCIWDLIPFVNARQGVIPVTGEYFCYKHFHSQTVVPGPLEEFTVLLPKRTNIQYL